jgi:hypothetical protein
MLSLTLLLMQRGQVKTVTNIPILVPCEPRHRQGLVTWAPDTSDQHVRVITHADLDPKSKRNPFRALSVADREFFLSVNTLLQGLERKDQIAIARARERVVVALGAKQGLNLNSDWVRRTASQLGLRPGREALALILATLDPRQSQDIRYLFSGVVSGELDSVRLVLWWYGGRFRPALYCLDLKSALFTFILMRTVGRPGWGACPHCGDFFVQKRSDQAYCTIAHREAHRVARWRASKATTRSIKKGIQHGPRKAR